MRRCAGKGEKEMTTPERIQRLFKLASVAQEFEHIDLTTVDHFNSLREEFGLSKLILLIKEHAQNKTLEGISEPQTLETSNTNQNQNVVQRV